MAEKRRDADIRRMADKAFLTDLWGIKLAKGSIPNSIPPLTGLPLAPITHFDRYLADLVVKPLPEARYLASGHAYPHTQALWQAVARPGEAVTGGVEGTAGQELAIVGIIVKIQPRAVYGNFLTVWDHLGGVWYGAWAGGTDDKAIIWRRGTAEMNKPIWFGPKHLTPAGMRRVK